MKISDNDVTKLQSDYYGRLMEKFGPSVDAVASGKNEYKHLRYSKLSKLFGEDKEFTVHDVGMGLGHFYEYLKENFKEREIVYSGTEIVNDFYLHCKKHNPECNFYLRDLVGTANVDKYDYVILGGTFYHQCDVSRNDWENYIYKLLSRAFSMARKGISFNLITQYCDYYEKGLYYCNVPKLLDFVVGNLSRFFNIDHAYPLYELTVCVYKEDFMRSGFTSKEYDKYFG